MPEEWGDYILCRDVFHCPPSVLDEQDAYTVQVMLAIHNAYLKDQAAKAEKRKQGF